MWPFTRRTRVPRDDWQIRAEAYTEHTPDAWNLELRPWVNLFVYDDLQSGHRNHDWIKGNTVSVGGAITRKMYSLWKLKRGPGTEAFALDHSYRNFMTMPGSVNDIPYAPIMGELYRIPSSRIVDLDNYRQNGVIYTRVRIPIAVPFHKAVDHKLHGEMISKKERVVGLEAYCYLGNTAHWNPLLDNGYNFSPVRARGFRKPWERILVFDKQEYKE